MSTDSEGSFALHFSELPDPRTGPAKRHPLLDIVTIAVCAVISGADSFVDMAAYGRAKERWLREFLTLPHGIPSHDTFGRVFALLDPAQLETCVLGWVREVVGTAPGRVIALDGKTARRSHDRRQGSGPLHLVSAWATELGVALGQERVPDHGSEISALPTLLAGLDVRGAVVTIDAIGCQTKVAQTIVERGGDYVLALKRNQPESFAAVAELFADAQAHGFADLPHGQAETLEKGHGRIERRRCWAVTDPDFLRYLDPAGRWPGLQAVGLVEAERIIGDAISREHRFYLTSLGGTAAKLNAAVRAHWSIENQLHWVLDMAFDEDQSRVRIGNAAHNLALLRRLALGMLNQEQSTTMGVKAKRKRAGWDDAYLLQVIKQ
jgi:predicted transposase YbfD/YdcC